MGLLNGVQALDGAGTNRFSPMVAIRFIITLTGKKNGKIQREFEIFFLVFFLLAFGVYDNFFEQYLQLYIQIDEKTKGVAKAGNGKCGWIPGDFCWDFMRFESNSEQFLENFTTITKKKLTDN